MDPEITDPVTVMGSPAEAETRPSPPTATPTPDPENALTAPAESTVTQACCGCAEAGSHGDGGGTGGDSAPGYVYVLGRVHAVFPDLSVQHEFFQVAGADGSRDATDADAFHRVLSDPDHRYLARQMCYVLSVQGVDTYILEPADPAELDDLVEALRPVRDSRDLAVVVGTLGPIVPPGACQGLSVPVVRVEKIWAFDSRELIGAIDRPDDTPRKEFERTAKDVLDRVLQLNNNAGLDPTHRALNFLTVREQEIYRKTSEMRAEGYTLSAVEAGPSRLSSGSQTVITVVLSYTHRQTNVTEKWFVRVGLAGLFPFRVTPIQLYYTR
ncbi:cyanobactin maturation protease PatG family protein [Streptomyces europaeiscabiei]|uniref:cyanobactin maturation protease PatG family protein n=1 Tax=Streptomyces europaeiscabiei TaxID=146819 RepID=UPI0038F6162A